MYVCMYVVYMLYVVCCMYVCCMYVVCMLYVCQYVCMIDMYVCIGPTRSTSEGVASILFWYKTRSIGHAIQHACEVSPPPPCV